MRHLNFNKMVFHEKHNLTCRLGTQWASAAGEFVSVGNADDDAGRLDAFVYQTVCKRFNHIDEIHDALFLEHDPSCRTIKGLRQEMRNIYGDEFFETSFVTLVYFKLRTNQG